MNTTAFQRPEGQWTSSEKAALIKILREPFCKHIIASSDSVVRLSVKPLNVDGNSLRRIGNT